MTQNDLPSKNDQRAVRLEKLQKMRDEGTQPFPDRYECTHDIMKTSALKPGDVVRTAGRIMLSRNMGKLTFAHIQDLGAKIQICLQRDLIGVDMYKWFNKMVDIGDFVGIEGEMFNTKTGELTIRVKEYTFLSKSLHPLPEKWHGLVDIETCWRQRYLDLIMNDETRKRFLFRSKLISTMRRFLDGNDFVEVETPIIQTKPSGARARPFITHHNSLDMPAYLRIAPETYLKRLIVGGFNRVYEFARCFRNEGMDPSHLQDFTMLEYYSAYWNYEDNIAFTQKLIKHIVEELYGTLKIKRGDNEINFDGEWPRMSFRELILRDSGIDIAEFDSPEPMRAAIKAKGIEIEKIDELSIAGLTDQLYKKVSQPNLIDPMFLTGHSIELSPLARRNDENAKITDRFQLVINGWEVVNAYSELIDPVDQRQRFEAQARMKDAGDDEAMPMDEDYLTAMEHGMPPNSGWGMGIDRFVSLLTDSANLRDVVLFPLMKPIGGAGPAQTPTATKSDAPTAQAEEQIDDAGITRERALELLAENITGNVLRCHCLASGAVMKALAEHLGRNPQVWEIAGIVHDLDFDRVQDEDKHTLETAEILRKEGAHPILVQAVLAHNAEGLGLERKTQFDFALTCCESITGLVAATALIMPDKKLAGVKAKSVVKRMKKKDFARKVNRDLILLCENVGMSVEDFAEMSLKAMQSISDDLGL